jgi:hypothetical protein
MKEKEVFRLKKRNEVLEATIGKASSERGEDSDGIQPWSTDRDENIDDFRVTSGNFGGSGGGGGGTERGNLFDSNSSSKLKHESDHDSLIASFKKKLSTANETARRAVDETMSLKSENIQLKMKIKEMEIFLADYGLTWRGNGSSVETDINVSSSVKNSSGGSGEMKSREGETAVSLKQEDRVDFDLLISKVEELNSLVANTGPRLVVEGNRC